MKIPLFLDCHVPIMPKLRRSFSDEKNPNVDSFLFLFFLIFRRNKQQIIYQTRPNKGETKEKPNRVYIVQI